MITYSAVTCVDQDFGIGYKNDLLFKSKIDLQHFKDVTEGKIVILGRKTADSIAKMNGALLPNRTKLILTRDENYYPNIKEKDDSILIYNSLDHLFFSLNLISNFNRKQDKIDEVVVIGGSEIYRIFEPHLDKLYLTEVDHSYDKKDSYFTVDMDKWIIRSSNKQFCVKEMVDFSINTYVRKEDSYGTSEF